MRNIKSLFLLILISIALPVYAVKGSCGLQHLIERYNSPTTTKAARININTISSSDFRGCEEQERYDSVYSKNTEHFVIYYTLKGPHRILDWEKGTNSEYLEIIANEIEKAHSYLSQNIGFIPPISYSFSSIYKQKIPTGKYAIEIADISLGNEITEGCGACYGMMIPDEYFNTDKSSIVIENDFIVAYSATKEEYIRDSDSNIICSYQAPQDTIYDYTGTINYYTHWKYALIPTVNHEFYHAFQYVYEDFVRASKEGNFHFWYEAGAVGYESLSSDYKDYVQYVEQSQEETNISMTSLKGLNQYGQCTFYQYLNKNLGENFDLKIWEAREALYPNNVENIAKTFYKVLKEEYNIELSKLYHSYAQEMSFAGDKYYYKNDPFSQDLNIWPQAYIFDDLDSIYHATPDDIKLDSLSFKLNHISQPNQLSNYLDWNAFSTDSNYNISVAQINLNDSIDFIKIDDFKNLPTLNKNLPTYVLISNGYQPTISIDSAENNKVYAYPNPFYYKNNEICFVNPNVDQELLQTSIEIYSSAGNNIVHIDQEFNEEDTQICWDGRNKSTEKLKAGFYYYRFTKGNDKKLHKFIILD